MREKARCCSVHRCLLARSAASGRCTCLYTCTPAPVTFPHNHIPSARLSRQCSRVHHCARYEYSVGRKSPTKAFKTILIITYVILLTPRKEVYYSMKGKGFFLPKERIFYSAVFASFLTTLHAILWCATYGPPCIIAMSRTRRVQPAILASRI